MPPAPNAPAVPGLQGAAAPPSGPVAPQSVGPTGAPVVPAAPTGGTPTGINIPGVPQLDVGQFNANASKLMDIPMAAQLSAIKEKADEVRSGSQAGGSIANQKIDLQVAQDKLDPGKYKLAPGSDGKIQAVGPDGKIIPIGEFVSRTGSQGLTTALDALKNSPNKQDQQFVSDYQNFEQFMNAAINKNNNKEAANVYESYVANNKQLANMTPQQAGQMFISEYGNYLGLTTGNQEPNQTQFTPQLSQSALNYLQNKDLYNQGSVSIPGYNFDLLNPNKNKGSSSSTASLFGI